MTDAARIWMRAHRIVIPIVRDAGMSSHPVWVADRRWGDAHHQRGSQPRRRLRRDVLECAVHGSAGWRRYGSPGIPLVPSGRVPRSCAAHH